MLTLPSCPTRYALLDLGNLRSAGRALILNSNSQVHVHILWQERDEEAQRTYWTSGMNGRRHRHAGCRPRPIPGTKVSLLTGCRLEYGTARHANARRPVVSLSWRQEHRGCARANTVRRVHRLHRGGGSYEVNSSAVARNRRHLAGEVHGRVCFPHFR